MTQVSQADLARRYKVSRKTVTKWKAQGRLVMVGKSVDLERTMAELRLQHTRRSKRVTPEHRMDVTSTPRSVTSLPKTVPPPPGGVCTVSALLGSSAECLAVLLLRLGHPRPIVQREVDAWFAEQRQGAVECIGEDFPVPAGLTSWAEHPVLSVPWMESTTWAELEALARGEEPA